MKLDSPGMPGARLDRGAPAGLSLVVVPHTHWDREWYEPFEVFRLRLVRLVDELLALFDRDPRYAHFMLDGQTIAVDDYLAIRPDRQAELARRVQSGQIAVGPWYVLADEFLVSGEALVRNLQIGIATARRLGREMPVGYLPDSFGHVAQMPQILAGFGFDSACLWRGVDDDVPGCEWRWEALDGTGVYMQWLYGGYGNLASLAEDPEDAIARIEAEVERLSARSGARTLLLMNGSDHLMPQPFLPDLIAEFNLRHPEWTLRQAPLTDAVASSRSEVAELRTVRGELRGASDTSLLPGVLSARTYLKQANVACQTLLERWVEPLTAIARSQGAACNDGQWLDHVWKTLLANHPHDSICGCSVDGVHRQMIARFEAAQQLGGALLDDALCALEDRADPAEPRQAGLRVYNPHPWPHRTVVEADLTLDCEPDLQPSFALVGEDGQLTPFAVLGLERGVRVVNRTPLYPLNVPTVKLSLRFVAELRALGFATWRVEPRPEASRQLTGPRAQDGELVVENQHLAVRALAGAVEIRDKASGQVVVHHLEDRGDRGDEYTFCAVEGDAPLDSRGGLQWTARTLEAAGGSQVLALEGTWPLPAELAADRRARAGTAPLAVRLAIALHDGVRRVDFELRVDNQSRDHRLRAAFEGRQAISETRADTPFGWVRRSSRIPVRDWPEPPVGTHPMASTVLLDGPEGTCGIAAPGLAEYEAEGRTLYVTLLRCVGWLSRDDLASRKGDAGPMLATPEAQCQGPASFRYAWIGQGASEAPGTAERRAAEFAVPVRASAVPARTLKGPTSASWLAIEPAALQFSALKPARSGQGQILRIYNGTDRPCSGRIALGLPVASAQPVRLDETPAGEPLAVRDGAIEVALGPFAIESYHLK